MPNPIPVYPLGDRLIETLKVNIKTTRTIPVLMGEAAIGKTSAIVGLEEREPDKFKVFLMQINQMAERGDLLAPRIVETEAADGTKNYVQKFFPHETFRQANDYALEHPDKTVIISGEEFNRAEEDIMSAFMTVLTTRRIGDIKFADNVRFIATGNDVGNVKPMDSAVVSRFSIYKVEPDIDTFLEIMGDNLNPWIRTVLEANPELLLCKPGAAVIESAGGNDDDADASMVFDDGLFAEETIPQFTAPRTIHGLSDWLNNVSRTFLAEMVGKTVDVVNPDGSRSTMSELAALLQGYTGATEFTAKLAVEISDSLISSGKKSTAGTNMPVAPASWGRILTQATKQTGATRDDVIREISGLSDDEINAVLAHSLTDNHSAAGFIAELTLIALNGRQLQPNAIATSLLANNGATKEALEKLEAADAAGDANAASIRNMMQLLNIGTDPS